MNTSGQVSAEVRKRLLIEEWLPIAEIGEESMRERRSMTALPPTYYLHVWFARRPLVASRAAVLASLLPADADRAKFLHTLGIHGDPVEAKRQVLDAVRRGIRVDNPYTYDRAFSYTPTADDLSQLDREVTVLDPTAGGGSIPFEATRLGLKTLANDLNPVAWLVMKCTLDFPLAYGASNLLERFESLSKAFHARITEQIQPLFPTLDNKKVDVTYLWARTITCPYCAGKVPLSPMWNLTKTTGVRLVPVTEKQNRFCHFEVVDNLKDMSKGTVKGGAGLCPFPDCAQVIDGDHIKEQAQTGKMGQQLYAVVYKEVKKVGETKTGKAKLKKVRGFRAPRPEDDVEAFVAERLAEKMLEWQARDIVPSEPIPYGNKTSEALRYGMPLWRDMFSPRQLFGHCTSVEVFQDLVAELKAKNNGELDDVDRAALNYIAIACSKLIDWNSKGCTWHHNRQVVGHTFQRHDFALKWSMAEMAPTISGLGYDWVFKQTGKALKELCRLVGKSTQVPLQPQPAARSAVTCASADSLSLVGGSVDAIVMDPPYYDNVMYAELADFFYVWLKRTAGLLYPEVFSTPLTDKDREATANAARFKGEKGAKAKAGADYQQRMADIFKECRRVLKPEGVMTLMFTHKANGAWDALTKSLVEAGFVITASWPVNTEAEGSLHIKNKSAAKSTIFLVCRVRPQSTGETRYWEDIEPHVAAAVRERVKSFQDAGIFGVDLYLACFGPALQVFSEAWPLTRGEPRTAPKPKRGQKAISPEEFDAFAVTPEDALDSARREVKSWRLLQLAHMSRQQHLDALTEWFILAWDAFRAPRFPADEALRLSRVVGLDFDRDIKNVLCTVKGNDVTMRDSKVRKLRKWTSDCLIDTLHSAAYIAQTQNIAAARELLVKHELLDNPSLKSALEAVLKVLPAVAMVNKTSDSSLSNAVSDSEALRKLYQLAFADPNEQMIPPQSGTFDFGRELAS